MLSSIETMRLNSPTSRLSELITIRDLGSHPRLCSIPPFETDSMHRPCRFLREPRLLESFLAGLLLAGLAAPTAPLRAADPPHIVMAFADDWGKYASIYGKLDPGEIHDHVATPNFDRVAEDGLLFTRAFVSAPSCTPCRSSLLSGQHFWRCGRGAILQGAIWDRSIPSYPLLLEDSGYRIGHTYKVWSPGTPADDPHGGAARKFQKHGSRFNGFSQNAMANPNHDSA
jgi:hypothetical protein